MDKGNLLLTVYGACTECQRMWDVLDHDEHPVVGECSREKQPVLYPGYILEAGNVRRFNAQAGNADR